MHEPQQPRLTSPPPISRPIDDFIGCLPPKVMPTTVGLLETGGHVLLVKHLRHGQSVTGAQHRIFRALVQVGENPDAAGSFTVFCIWGVPGTQRALTVYDHMGTREVAVTTEDVRRHISDWWRNHEGRR